MAKLHLVKSAAGILLPATSADAHFILKRFKLGAVLRVDVALMRNGTFFRKWWVLAELAFDIWADGCPQQEFHGVQVLPEFDRFRRDLIIMAGFFRPVWNAKREMRVEAESLAWASMDEERFERLYSATIDVILQKVIPERQFDADTLRNMVDQVIGEFT
jgi:hypothetical protein